MKKNKWIVIAAVMGMCFFSNILSAQTPKYINSSLPTYKRVSDLVSKLSLAQKIKLMQYTVTAVETKDLKIPAYNWFLTGKMASSFVRGLQGNNPKYFKTIATVKHFAVHSGPESQMHRFNANIRYDFYHTYTHAFRIAIQDAGVYSLTRDTDCQTL